MARTFIGELLFMFKDDASAKAAETARKLTSTFDTLAQEASRLNSMNWSWKFQQDIEKLGASAAEIDKIRSAWNQLHDSFQTRGLDAKGMSAEIAAFESATKQRLASFNKIVSDHQKEVVARTRNFSNTIQSIMKPALVAMGGYTGAYMIGVGTTSAITAASNEQRERARQHFAGLPKEEQDRIEKLSQELSTRYNTRQADAMEIMREARLSMPSADAAFGLAEQMIQGYKMLGLMFGGQKGIDGLRAFNKAMDNINVNQDPQEYRTALDAYIKAQQITGKDMDPESFAQAIKYARTSGKVFGHDFLFNWLPYIIAESGGSDAGTQLRAAFDQFIVGRASKKALAAQEEYGLRQDGKLVGQDQFGQNPIAWINEVLLPALKNKGVNVDDNLEVARVMGDLTNNRLSSDLLSRVLLSYQQYKRQVDMGKKAVGLEGAADVGAIDPFTALDEFKGAFANLAAAVLPAKGIAEGLNTIASGVNALQSAYRDGDPLAKLGMGAGAGAAAFGAYKVWSAITGLITAGTNLNAAAVSLEAAALSLRGGGVGETLKAGGSAAAGGLAAILKRAGVLASLLFLPGDTPEDGRKPKAMDNATTAFFADKWNREHPKKDWRHFLFGAAADGGGLLKHMQIENHVSDAKKAGEEIKQALDITAKPDVDSSAIDAAIAKAQQLKSLLSGIASAAAAAHNKVEKEMQRNFADHGVSP